MLFLGPPPAMFRVIAILSWGRPAERGGRRHRRPSAKKRTREKAEEAPAGGDTSPPTLDLFYSIINHCFFINSHHNTIIKYFFLHRFPNNKSPAPHQETDVT
jgi:hypothetical protein